jgi:hypothetical protein
MARIFLAGGEPVELFRALLENGCEDVLLSFYYIQKRGALPSILQFLKQYPDVRVFIDSGAQSFLKKADGSDPQMYWKAYYDFLKQHGHRFEFASEFDIDGYQYPKRGKTIIVSDEQITVWRDDLCELGTVAIVPVWRPARGAAAWDAYCTGSQFTHVGIGDTEDMPRGAKNALVAKAHSWNKGVHGFGQTRVLTDLPYITYDTISSTTWLVGQKYGDIFVFDAGTLQRLAAGTTIFKARRKTFKKYFIKIGCDWKKIEAGDRKEVNKANILAWLQFSKRSQLQHQKAPKQPPAPPQAPIETFQASVSSPKPENAVQGRTEVLDPLPEGEKTGTAPISGVPAVTVERTTEPAITLQTIARPFMPVRTPSLRCSNCAMGDACPEYNPERVVCAFKDAFGLVYTRDANSVVDELASLFALNIERGRYMRLAEELVAAGNPSMAVSKHLDMTFHQGIKLAELMKGKKSARATVQGQGAIDRIFGGIGGSEPVQVAGTPKHVLPVEEHEDDDDLDEESEDKQPTERQKQQQAQFKK